MADTRNEIIDFLRVLGLCLIVFAHVNPPYFLFQLRNFDVPLMVIVSAMSFSLAYRPDQSYGRYVLSRIKRLVLPVWLFLTGYFLILYCINPASDSLNEKTILESYSFFGGIGYVWIIRVFILVALVAPFLYRYHLKTASHTRYLVSILCVYLLYELSLYCVSPYLEVSGWKYVFEIVFYIVPYALLFALGLRISQLSVKQNTVIAGGALCLFVLLAIFLSYKNGYIVPTQHYKYPPSAYYLSFALLGCLSAYLCASFIWNKISSLKIIKSILLFMAGNSLWIYLWHIPFVEAIEGHFLIKYPVVLTLPTILVFIQVSIVKKIILPKLKSNSTQKLIKAVLTG